VTRKVKSEAERAQEELDVATRRAKAAWKRWGNAAGVAAAAQAEWERLDGVRQFRAAHPALREPESDLDAVMDAVTSGGPS